MPFEWFVALRYLRDAKGQTALILAAVSVGVSVVVFLSALIGGLQVSLIDKTLGSQPHVTLRVPREVPRPLTEPTETLAIARDVQASAQRLRSIDQWPVVMADVERVPGVAAVSATVSGAGFAVRGDAKAPIVFTGIDRSASSPSSTYARRRTPATSTSPETASSSAASSPRTSASTSATSCA